MLSSTKSTNKKLIQPQPIPPNLHSSCTTLTKSKSQHATKYSNPNVVKVKETILVKVQDFQQNPKNEKIKKEWEIKESIDDVKKAHSLRSKSYNEGFGDIKMQSLLSRSHNEGCGDIKMQSLGSRSYNEGCGDIKIPSLEARSYNEGCGDIKMQSLGSRSYNEGCGDIKMQSLGSKSYKEGCGDIKMQSLLRRKSFCSSKTELADFFVSCGVKVVAVDMPPFMQIHAVDCARKAHDSLEKFTARTLACTLKREFDGVYGPAWHCIVGTSFGSFVTHSVGGFMYFSMDQKLYVLLFKTTVQKAE